MEGPLLSKSEHNVDDVTIHGDSSSNDEHIVDITINGNSSLADEQTPHEGVQWSNPFTNGCVWILVEFVVTLVQIVAAIFFLPLTKDEQNPDIEELWFTWIIGYTCASIVTLPLLCWRLWHCSETRTNEMIDYLEKMLAYFFVVWILIFLWCFLADLSSFLDDTTQQFWLWMALLAFSCIRYVLPNLEFAVKSFMLPVEYYSKQVSEFFKKMIIGIGILFCCIDDYDDDSSSNDERILDVTVNDNSSSRDSIVWNYFFGQINCVVWNLVEFLVTLVQLVAAIFVLTLTKDEQHPKKILVMLIISYTCGCIATLPILVWRFLRVSSDTRYILYFFGWRFLQYNRSVSSETRINEVMDNLKMMLGYFFVGWITVLLWHLLNNLSSLDYTTPHFWLCLAFFAISCVLHVFRHLRCSVICFYFPMLWRVFEFMNFADDVEEKLKYIGLAIFVCSLICPCICNNEEED